MGNPSCGPISSLQSKIPDQPQISLGLLVDDQGPSHPLDAGDQVAVFAADLSGQPFLEGWAKIVRRCARPHTYDVRFQNETRNRTRFVNPDWQATPDRSLALLIEFFRANRITNPSIADFFPDSPE
jgi:hypothetical protein